MQARYGCHLGDGNRSVRAVSYELKRRIHALLDGGSAEETARAAEAGPR